MVILIFYTKILYNRHYIDLHNAYSTQLKKIDLSYKIEIVNNSKAVNEK